MDMPSQFAGQIFDPKSKVLRVELWLMSETMGWSVIIHSRSSLRYRVHISDEYIDTDEDAAKVIRDFYRRLAIARKGV